MDFHMNMPSKRPGAQDRALRLMYGSAAGTALLRVLVSPGVSRAAGAFLDRPLSLLLVRPFVARYHPDLSDYPERSYLSFNDFFTRSVLPGRRPVQPDASKLISPCDGRITVFPLREDSRFLIKGCEYTAESLLRDGELSAGFCGGWGLLIRLSVDDYHRYVYPVTGRKGQNVHIPGVFHTVNPLAAEALPIYRENTREYTLIETPRYGTVLMMEIGAMLVGRIKNLHGTREVTRGEEKGYFEYGGSSVLLLLEKEHFRPDDGMLRLSETGRETPVRQGQSLGDLI